MYVCGVQVGVYKHFVVSNKIVIKFNKIELHPLRWKDWIFWFSLILKLQPNQGDLLFSFLKKKPDYKCCLVLYG